MQPRPLRNWIVVASWGLFVVAMGACGGEEPLREPSSYVRGAGKADGTNTCEGICGEQAPAGCWCDATCELLGDCCPDKVTSCDDAQPSCQYACGGKSKDGCWCDARCEAFGDCCPDKADLCESQARRCGGVTDPPCPNYQRCELEGDDANAAGQCVACDYDGDPDKDYAAKSARLCSVIKFTCDEGWSAFSDDCGCGCQRDEAQRCGGVADVQCPVGQQCKQVGITPDTPGICVRCDHTGDAETQYIGKSAAECAAMSFRCDEGWSYFSDDCGCGCKLTQ